MHVSGEIWLENLGKFASTIGRNSQVAASLDYVDCPGVRTLTARGRSIVKGVNSGCVFQLYGSGQPSDPAFEI